MFCAFLFDSSQKQDEDTGDGDAQNKFRSHDAQVDELFLDNSDMGMFPAPEFDLFANFDNLSVNSDIGVAEQDEVASVTILPATEDPFGEPFDVSLLR